MRLPHPTPCLVPQKRVGAFTVRGGAIVEHRMVKKEPNTEPSNTQQLLTILEVTRLLHVSRSMIYLLIGRGDLPTVRIGHAVRLRAEDVQAYIRKRSALPTKASKRRG